jgi:hypothetical protein
MPLKNILKMAKSLRLTCGDCIRFGTTCPNRGIILATDNADNCTDGLLVRPFGKDVIIRRAETTVIKPLRFISSDKTKNELFNTFELEDNEIAELILHIKLLSSNSTEKPEEPKPSKTEPPLSPEQKEKTLVLLKQPDILTKFLEHQDRYLIMDETVRKLILLTCCSAYGDYPLNLSLQQVFSAGKTTTTVQTSKYFPDCWLLGAMSPKSLVHEKAEFNEDKDGFIINLEGKVLIFLDEPQLETLAMLKPLLSHDTYETTYKYVDKESGKTTKAILKGFPSVIFCTTKSKYIMEFSSRWLTASPETSSEKIAKVIAAKGAKAAQTQQADPELETWKTAFLLLSKERYSVIIPYAVELSQSFRAKKPIDMRFFDLFLALIKATTILHAFQREKDQNGNLKATIQDYEEAYKVFHEIEQPTTLGLGQNVLDFYQNIIKPLQTENETVYDFNDPTKPTRTMKTPITYETLMQKYQETTEESISRSTLRDTFLKPLEAKGLIDFEPDPKDKRKKNIIVKNAIPETSLINDKEFKKRIARRAG